VVPSNNPGGVSVVVCKLFTQPRFPDTGFAGDNHAATCGCDGVYGVPQHGDSTGTRHCDRRFDGVSFRDGTEIGDEPGTGRSTFPCHVSIEGACAGGRVCEGECRMFGCDVAVGCAAGAQLFGDATQQYPLSGPGTGEVER
jgi:hypothetical protein